MGLRLTAGIRFKDFAEAVGRPLADFVDHGRLAELINDGFLARDDRALRATRQGLPVLNAVLAELLAGR